MMVKLRLTAILGLLFVICWLPPITLAQEPTFDDINDIADELSCPTCQGINLTNCPTVTCAQWKEQIGDLLAEGYTKEEIKDYFVTRHGQQVLQEPPASGLTLPLWVLPLAALLMGAIWLIVTMRRWQTPQPAETPQPPQPAALSHDYLSQVEHDLKHQQR